MSVTFRIGQQVSEADIARITIAFASDDLYPAGLPGFFRVCLDAPSLEWVQVFTGDALAGAHRRAAVAIEPMSAPPDAFNSGTDLLRIEPGQVVTHRWGIAYS